MILGYSTTALRRIWRAQDFSNYMTQLLRDPGTGTFRRELQLSRIDYVARSETAARSLAENYVGLPRHARLLTPMCADPSKPE